MGMAALDLLFQVVFYAQMAQEEGRFNFDDICAAISDKLEIAQLTAQVVKILSRNSVQHFIGFFEGIGGDGGKGPAR
jgi:hypothetical protein